MGRRCWRGKISSSRVRICNSSRTGREEVLSAKKHDSYKRVPRAMMHDARTGTGGAWTSSCGLGAAAQLHTSPRR
jgi:hypothetical protein